MQRQLRTAEKMLWSETLIPTIKETPEAAEIPSHVLMLRAGLIGRASAGAYAYLPLGMRCRRKAVELIRRQMEAAGALEVALPALSPVALWEKTGRDESFGDELIRFSVRRHARKARLALAPAHEEIVAEIVSRLVSSYRQMPLLLYRVGRRFRNRPRPGSGVMGAGEFMAADAYSFDVDGEALERSYRAVYEAYCRVFQRCGLSYLAVEAESPLIGGKPGNEFVVPTPSGEDSILHCVDCGYAANRRRAEIGARDSRPPEGPFEELRRIDTPGCSTVEQVTGLLGCCSRDLIKTLIYLAGGQPIAVLVRGDHEANEAKIRRAAGAERVELAEPGVIREVTGAGVGFSGPVGMKQAGCPL